MARKLALIALLLVLGLALWLRKGSAPQAPPLAAPSAQPAEEPTLDSAQTESMPEDRREAVATSEPTKSASTFDPPPQIFCGRVVSRDDNTPIAGASLANRKLKFATGANGRFVLPASNNVYTIAAEGFAEVRFAPQGGHEKPEKELVIELDRGGTLIGVLANSGRLAASGELRFQVSADISRMLLADPDATGGHVGLRGMRDWRAEFDATGRAVISGLPPRIPLRVAVLEGRTKVLVSEDIRLTPSEQREVMLDPSGTCELTGCVRDDADQPVAALPLWLMPASASAPRMFESSDEQKCATTSLTGDDGRFRIPGVAPGSWLLGPGCVSRTNGEPSPNDAVAPFPTRIEIPTGSPALEIVLRVHRGITIRGRVLDNEDKPARALVLAVAPSSFVSGHADKDGKFELGPLVPGSYSLQAGFNGTHIASETVDVEAGAQDVVLRVSRGATLTGQAVDEATGAGVEASLTITLSVDAQGSMSVIHSRADGSFEFSGLKPGGYLLTASTRDGRYGMLRALEVGALSPVEDVRIALTPGASVRVGYDGRGAFGELKILRDGEPLARHGITRGKPTKVRVPSGSLRLVFTVGGKEQLRDLVLKAGEEQELVFKDED